MDSVPWLSKLRSDFMKSIDVNMYEDAAKEPSLFSECAWRKTTKTQCERLSNFIHRAQDGDLTSLIPQGYDKGGAYVNVAPSGGVDWANDRFVLNCVGDLLFCFPCLLELFTNDFLLVLEVN